MTDLDRDERLLVASLHAQLDDVRPDLTRLAAGATRQGARIRRRRRAGAGLAGAACAGLVLGGVFLLPGLGADRTASQPGLLGSPAGEPTPEVTRIQESAAPGGQDLTFTIAVPDGWSCEDPADEKLGCHDSSAPIPETAQVTVVQRTVEHHAEYVGMKSDGYAVSDPHDGYFVSIQPDPDATGADVQLIAEALTWDDGIPVF